MNEKTLKWLNAAKVLRQDPNAKVLCPNCNSDYLTVKDVVWPNGKKYDRHLICPNCNEYNTITFSVDTGSVSD